VVHAGEEGSGVCNCSDDWIGDGHCDGMCNVAECGFDGGDCAFTAENSCAPDCYQTMIGNGF
jgi:hypothetical protein